MCGHVVLILHAFLTMACAEERHMIFPNQVSHLLSDLFEAGSGIPSDYMICRKRAHSVTQLRPCVSDLDSATLGKSGYPKVQLWPSMYSLPPSPFTKYRGVTIKEVVQRRKHSQLGAASRQLVVRSAADIPTMLLTTPHTQATRQWFYDDVTASILEAFKAGKTRVKVRSEFTELNRDMGTFRSATLLELVREVALAVAEGGKQVRVCMQEDGGMTNWRERMKLPNFIKLGSISNDTAQPDDTAFILIQPKNDGNPCNSLGNTCWYNVQPDLQEMMQVVGDRPVVMINPDEGEKGMTERGRKERLEYWNSWEEVYCFLLLTPRGRNYPIYGALRKPFGCDWELYQRTGRLLTEVYELRQSYPSQPSESEINQVLLEED